MRESTSTSNREALHFERLDATFGAVVTGIRVTDVDETTFDEIYRQWLDLGLLTFPDQHLTVDEVTAFASRFGPLEFEAVTLSNVHEDGRLRDEEGDEMVKILRGNMGWHSDSTYLPVQAKGAVLSVSVAPPKGGETAWADMEAAYEALDAALRERISGLKAYHSLIHSQAEFGQSSGYGMDVKEPPLRPLVKIHPETGRPSLLVGRHAYGIPGMDPDESAKLLEHLMEISCRPPRVYEHAWRPGDVVVQDNRRLLHRALPWDMRHPRVLRTARIKGDPRTEFAAPT